jgi:hypothetical protein
MKRLIVTFVGIGAVVALGAGPALAFQCPKLIGQINAAAGNRLDSAGYDAREKAAEAQKLHAEGKHAESVKAAQEGLAKLGISQ